MNNINVSPIVFQEDSEQDASVNCRILDNSFISGAIPFRVVERSNPWLVISRPGNEVLSRQAIGISSYVGKTVSIAVDELVRGSV